MNNGLLFLGALLVAILAALFAVPNFVDWNSYRGVFEEEASKVLGRDVRVGGNVNLKFLPVPYVRFEKIRIASVTGQSGEPFIRADSFTMWLSVPALLRGVLEASQIELEKPVLSLAVDDNGVGNWTKLELKPGDLPFVPRDVALRSVQITDGTVSVYNAASAKIASVDGIEGVFSADGLKGPFRYSGGASWGGNDYDVKFATDVPDSDDTFALKLSAHADRSPSVFGLDGRVYHPGDKTTFKGVWSGKIQVPGSPTVEPQGNEPPPLINLRSDVTADAAGAKLENLALTIDNAAEPQTVAGSAVAKWSEAPRLDVSLNSKWLDVDWLAGAGQGSAGFAKLKRLALALMQSVAGDSTASAKINLEQVKIGGENSGGLSIDAERQRDVTHLKTFKVSLPGGSRLDLAGDLKNAGGKLSFSGNGFLGGSSFGRFKAWADKSGIPIDVDADGPYSAAGKLEIDEARFFLTEASGDISGRPLAGEFKVVHGDREHTELTLQAADLDTHEIFPKVTETLRAEFRKSLGLALRKEDRDADQELPGDVRLRVIAGRLIDGDDIYRDVDVSFVTEGRRLSLPVAKLTTDGGLEIGLKGRIETRDNGSVGTLAYDFVGPTSAAMHDLARKAGLIDVIGEDRFKGLKDGKIAGLIHLGLRAPKSADVSFDGLINGSKINGQAEFDGGFEDWQSQSSQMQATVNAASVNDFLALLGRDVPQTGKPPHPVSASLITVGTLASGSKSQIEISSQDFSTHFDGHAQWAADSQLALDGVLDVKALQGDQVIAVAGLPLPGGATGLAMQGTLDVQRDRKGSLTLAAQDFSLGASKVSGRVTVMPVAGVLRIDGDVNTDRVTLPGLLAVFSDASPVAVTGPAGTNATSAIAVGGPPLWPEGLFNFASFGDTNANVKIGFKSIDIRGGLGAGNGTMTVALTPGKLTIADIEATAAGGRLAGQASFESVANGVAFVSNLTLDQAKLSSINANGKGVGTFALRATARAQSPAGLIAVMTGSGTAKLAGAELSGPSPSMLADVVEDVLTGKIQNDEQAIGNALVAAAGPSTVSLGDRDLSVSISDGTLKISGIDSQSADGNVEGTATADLATLAMNASFQVTTLVRSLSSADAAPNRGQAQAPATKGPLPAATVLYSGQLDHLATLSIDADVGDLQRELTVRQMERNVEELEQARRADQERARLEKEAERKRKEAAARAAAAAAQQKVQEQQQQLPPVIPESAGTENSSAPGAAGNSDDFFGAAPSDGAPDARASNPSAPRLQQQNSTAPVHIDANTQQGATIQPQRVVIDPSTGLPVQTPAPAEKPAAVRSSSQPTRPAKQRTSSDEVMKTLRGVQ